MRNFISIGNNVDAIAPGGGVVSGVPVLIGTSLLLVPIATKAAGEDFAGSAVGVFTLPKLSGDTHTAGNKVNFNTATGNMQSASSTLDNAATVVETAAGGTTEAKYRLTPV